MSTHDIEICECGRVHETKRPLMKRRESRVISRTRPLFPGDQWGRSTPAYQPVSMKSPVQQVSWQHTDDCGECGEAELVSSGCHAPSCSQPVWIESGCHAPSCSQPVWIESGCHAPSCSQPVWTESSCHAPVVSEPCDCTPAPSPPASCNSPIPAPAPAPQPAPVPPAEPACNAPAPPACSAPAADPPSTDFLPPVEEPGQPAPPDNVQSGGGGVPIPKMVDPVSWQVMPALPPLH